MNILDKYTTLLSGLHLNHALGQNRQTVGDGMRQRQATALKADAREQDVALAQAFNRWRCTSLFEIALGSDAAFHKRVVAWQRRIFYILHRHSSPIATTESPEDIDVHMGAGCWSSWHDEWMQVGTTHHDAVYQTVHHEATYQTTHHEAETTIVHHDATGHNEQAVDQAAWDETVITGYTCSGCGAVKGK